MRKIQTKKEKDLRDKRLKMIMGIFTGFLLTLSIAGFALTGTENNGKIRNSFLIYNGHKFISQDNRWYLSYEGKNFTFENSPKKVEKINSTIKGISNYYSKPLYLYSKNLNATSEIYLNLKNIATRIQPACLSNCSENVPIKTCRDNFIIIKVSNKTRVYQKENCVFIEGSSEDISILTQSVLFKILDLN